ncbi:MAG TPA: histidine kinase [Spirochaetia bacterium]|nr:histidine kinase [Spirochaetia bacterium]
MRLRQGLFSKLLISYVALSLFPVVLIGIFSYEAAAAVLRNHILQASQVALNQTGRNIDFVLDQAIAAINVTMMDPQIEEGLSRNFTSAYDRIKAVETMESSLLQYSSALLSEPMQIILVGANGVTATNAQRETTLTLRNLPSVSWYAQVSPSEKQVTWIGVHGSYVKGQSDVQVFSAAKALTNPYSGRTYGMLLLQIDLSFLGRMLPESTTFGREVTLVDRSGEVVATDSNIPGTMAPESLRNVLFSDGPLRIIQSHGQSDVYLTEHLSRAGLTLYERIPLSVFEGEIYQLRNRVLLLLLAVLLVSTGYAFIVARRISRPLIRLRNRIATEPKYRDGYQTTMPVAPAVPRGDEVGAIFAGYDSLVHKLEVTVDQLVREQREKRKAEIHALQMQINPHFLFNTLKSIKCLVWTGRSDLIESVVNSLIRLLEQSLRNTDELELLSAQLDQVGEFVRIQEIRLSHPIDISVQLSEAASCCMLPKLIVQPLVENAIVHGIESRIDVGRIWVNGSVADDAVTLEVMDNGAGCEQEVIDALLGHTDVEETVSHHIGLRNVDARLRAVFGSEYRMKVKSRPGVSTSVSIRFPFVHKEEQVHDSAYDRG